MRRLRPSRAATDCDKVPLRRGARFARSASERQIEVQVLVEQIPFGRGKGRRGRRPSWRQRLRSRSGYARLEVRRQRAAGEPKEAAGFAAHRPPPRERRCYHQPPIRKPTGAPFWKAVRRPVVEERSLHSGARAGTSACLTTGAVRRGAMALVGGTFAVGAMSRQPLTAPTLPRSG